MEKRTPTQVMNNQGSGFRTFHQMGYQPGLWPWLMPTVPLMIWINGSGSGKLFVTTDDWIVNSLILAFVYAGLAVAGFAGDYLYWRYGNKRWEQITPGSLILLVLVSAWLLSGDLRLQATASPPNQEQQSVPEPVKANTLYVPSPMRQSYTTIQTPPPPPPGFTYVKPGPTPEQVIADQQRLIELLAESQAQQQVAHPEPVTLRLRRWWLDWDRRGRGTLTIQLANHGGQAVHVNAASIQPGRWSYVARHVQPASTLSYSVAVGHEPVYIDLETSQGVLRFDLIPE